VYRLKNTFVERRFCVSIVGCGGTGGYAAESLCRLLWRHATLILIDNDRVEERNLARQNFLRNEIGEFKSEVLAKRLSQRFNRGVGYSTLPVSKVHLPTPGLVIGCVDNGLARKDIARQVRIAFDSYSLSIPSWWVDAGNGDCYGQVIIGNGAKVTFEDREPECCYELPLPTIQQPDLLKQAPQPQSCALNDEQNPTINLVMASLVVDVVRRILEGTCPWSQLYLDLQAGTLTPVYISSPKY
jgi:molybdopterin/thiamine biosynthesis adenylyltransferase